MSAVRYVLHPGVVIEEGATSARLIGAGELASLYGVAMEECVVDYGTRVGERNRHNRERDPYAGLTHLRPRPDGNYILPGVMK